MGNNSCLLCSFTILLLPTKPFYFGRVLITLFIVLYTVMHYTTSGNSNASLCSKKATKNAPGWDSKKNWEACLPFFTATDVSLGYWTFLQQESFFWPSFLRGSKSRKNHSNQNCPRGRAIAKSTIIHTTLLAECKKRPIGNCKCPPLLPLLAI